MEKPSNPKGPPAYNVQIGSETVNLLEHLSAAELGFEVPDEPEDTPEDKPAGEPNAHLEGEQTVKDEEEAKEPEPTAPPKEEEKPKEEAKPPPSPDEIEYTLKVKVQGEERELKLSKDELIKRVQLAEDYYKKTAEVADMKRKIEPHLHVIDTPEYIDWLKDRREAGQIREEPDMPVHSATDEYEYIKRTADPDFLEIQAELRAFAATLPVRGQELLSSDYQTFNREYDRIASERRARKARLSEPPPQQPPPVDPKVQEKILQAKEKAKENAVVETPGAGKPEDTAFKEWKRKEKELVKRMKGGDDEAAIELILHREIFKTA